jgi:hypothetical protein
MSENSGPAGAGHSSNKTSSVAPRGGPGAKTQTKDSKPTKYKAPTVTPPKQPKPPKPPVQRPTAAELAAAAAAEAARVAAENERKRLEAEARAEAERQRLAAEAARLAAIAEAARLAEIAARALRSSSEFGVVKNPTRDVLNFSSLVPSADAKKLERVLWEQMSAIELSTVLRHDTVDGINQRYAIISNLSELRRRYDSTRELSILNKSTLPYSEFSIDLSSKIPDSSYISRNGLDSTYKYLSENGTSVVEVEKGYVYVAENGDIVIELNNLLPSEIIQVQVDADGTMYEVNN